jgi:hypothetical protein
MQGLLRDTVPDLVDTIAGLFAGLVILDPEVEGLAVVATLLSVP